MVAHYVEAFSHDGASWLLVYDPALPLEGTAVAAKDEHLWAMGRFVTDADPNNQGRIAASLNALTWAEDALPDPFPRINGLIWGADVRVGVAQHGSGAGTKPLVSRMSAAGTFTSPTSPMDGFTTYGVTTTTFGFFLAPRLLAVTWGEDLFVAGGYAVNEQTITAGPAWPADTHWTANMDGSVTWDGTPGGLTDMPPYDGTITLAHPGQVEFDLVNAPFSGGTFIKPKFDGVNDTSATDDTTGTTRRFRSLILAAGSHTFQAAVTSGRPSGYTVGPPSIVYRVPKTLMSSPDGTTWTNRPAPWSDADSIYDQFNQPHVNALGYGDGIFVAGGYGLDPGAGFAARAILTSPDGTTWTARSSPMNGRECRCLAYSPTLDLWAAFTDATSIVYMTSPDGATWTSRTDPLPDTGFHRYRPHDVAWSPTHGLFILVGQDVLFDTDDMTFASHGAFIATSPDGLTWTKRTIPFDPHYDSDLNKVTAAGGTIVAVGTGTGRSPGVLPLRQQQRPAPARLTGPGRRSPARLPGANAYR